LAEVKTGGGGGASSTGGSAVKPSSRSTAVMAPLSSSPGLSSVTSWSQEDRLQGGQKTTRLNNALYVPHVFVQLLFTAKRQKYIINTKQYNGNTTGKKQHDTTNT